MDKCLRRRYKPNDRGPRLHTDAGIEGLPYRAGVTLRCRTAHAGQLTYADSPDQKVRRVTICRFRALLALVIWPNPGELKIARFPDAATVSAVAGNPKFT